MGKDVVMNEIETIRLEENLEVLIRNAQNFGI